MEGHRTPPEVARDVCDDDEPEVVLLPQGVGPAHGKHTIHPPPKKQLNTQTCISSKKNVFYKIQPKNCYGKHFSPPTSVKKVWPLGFWTREYEKSIYLATFM